MLKEEQHSARSMALVSMSTVESSCSSWGPRAVGKRRSCRSWDGILRPTSGVVRILGREVSSLDERELPKVRLEHVGFVFQGFNLFPALTASQNIELVLHLKGRSRREARRRAAELLDQVDLGEPRIILADEPTAALDSQSGLSVIRLLRDLAHERRRAVVLVTHDSRILEFADRIVGIEDGRIVAQSKVDERASLVPSRTRTGRVGIDPKGLAVDSRKEQL